MSLDERYIVKTLGDLKREGLDIDLLLKTINGGVMIMNIDNRKNVVNGVTATNQQLNFGDSVSMSQTVGALSEDNIKKLFDDLYKTIKDNGDERDIEIAGKVEESIMNKNWDAAKMIFGALPKVIQVSAAGISIAKAFGWM
ncbi:hypothetical protein C1I60_16195 [Paenibacillus terrae]|uniref:Uncharacterized protein n=1 Tax=Paenibacillus terrae TaxID=159743 RepID=A0A4U2PWF8_9BACL|nr:hypothetical protein [Paenibacillus terrae]TKH43059.1 hypothetical protein C1I60_16195 [Paenibacillus terrae]